MPNMNDSNGSRVAVLIDYENVFIGFRKKISKDESIKWDGILESLKKRYGSSLVCKAYADWSDNGGMQDILSKLGIQIITVPSKRTGKNSVDVRIAVDAIDMLVVKNFNNIRSLVLISGDGDFTPLVHYLKDFGKYVVGIGIKGSTAKYLESACHEFKYLLKNSELADAGQEPVGELKEPSAGDKEPQPAAEELLPLVAAPQTAAYEPQPVAVDAEPVVEEQIAAAHESKEKTDPTEEYVRKYLDVLHKHQIPLEPTENRPFIIQKAYWKIRKYAGKPLSEIREKVSSYFKREHAGVDNGHVDEIFDQMVKAECFNLINGSGGPSKSSSVWERKAYLKTAIDHPKALLRALDKFLVGILRRESGPEEINCEALSTVLHGSSQKPELDHWARQLASQKDQPTPDGSS